MIVNPDKLQAIVLGKRKSNSTMLYLLLAQKKFRLYNHLIYKVQR